MIPTFRPSRLIAFISLIWLASCAEDEVGTLDQEIASDSGARRYGQVAVGLRSACALSRTGTVYCWGNNFDGQLGNGTTTESHVPVLATGLTNQALVATRMNHVCSVGANGRVSCWGNNGGGQIGDGTTTDRLTPTTVTFGAPLFTVLANVSDVAPGWGHTCALDASGDVWCWGDGAYGQLGDGTTTGKTRPTVKVSGVSNAVDLASGYDHTCAVIAGGTVKCWGRNLYGQLGDGTQTNRSVATTVPGLTQAVSISASAISTCATLANHTVRCWGNNTDGELGIGNTTSPQLSPVWVHGPGNVGTLLRVVSVDGGSSHRCAATSDGNQYCWGRGSEGQLGNGGTAAATAPTLVATGIFASATSTPGEHIAAGGFTTCVRSTDGNFWCFGWNANGQVGDNTIIDRIVPTWNLIPAYMSAGPQVVNSHTNTCVLMSNGGKVYCWGWNAGGVVGDGTAIERFVPVQVSGLGNVVGIAAGYEHMCALLSSGGVKCWGDNGTGQLGDGTSNNFRSTPVAVLGLADAVAISAGLGHTCALLADGTGRCWGFNGTGGLGNGTTNNASTPVAVINLQNGVTLSAGSEHTCAVRADGTAACWGDNANGQLGDGTTTQRTSATTVSGLSSAVGIAGLADSSCARLANGSVKCWGNNFYGQLGDGTTTAHLTPAAVPGLDNVIALSGNSETVCTIDGEGVVMCWGHNHTNQIGDGTIVTRLVPTANGISNALQISSGPQSTCISSAGAQVICWGRMYPGNGSIYDTYLTSLQATISP